MKDKAIVTKSGSRDGEDLEKGQKPGDIILFKRATGFAHVITFFTHSPYYHAAIADEDLHVVEARPRGVMRRDLRSRDGGHVFTVFPMRGEDGKAALAWARSHVGGGYDKFDVVVIVLEHIFRRLRLNYKPPSSRFTCAEFVALAFEKTGHDLFPDKDSAEIVPADFARLHQSIGDKSG